VQVLGLLEGIDVFDLEPLDPGHIGALADPIKVCSVVRVSALSFSVIFPYTLFRTQSVSSDAQVHLLTLMMSCGSV
jgi:hypothetical protein